MGRFQAPFLFAALPAYWQYCRHYPRPPLRLHGEVKAIVHDLNSGGDLGDIANYMDLNCPALSQLILSLQLAPRRQGRSGESRALCANAHGFSLLAGVRVAVEDRRGLEQLCRYIIRPAISNERLSVSRSGQVVLKLKTVWRDGTSHHVMAPMVFMQRLAAQPPPRAPTVRVDLFEDA